MKKRDIFRMTQENSLEFLAELELQGKLYQFLKEHYPKYVVDDEISHFNLAKDLGYFEC